MKKLIGFLLALCLIAGLLPMAAMAETKDPAKYGNWAKIRFAGNVDVVVTKGQPAQYLKNGANGKPTKCKETDDWNVKLYYDQDWVVMVLKGAKIGTYNEETNTFSINDYAIAAAMLTQPEPSFQWKIIIEEDSYLKSAYAGIYSHGAATLPWGTNMTIESVGDAKLSIFTTGMYGGLMDTPWADVDYTLTLNNANLDITNTADYQKSPALGACNVVMNGGNVNLTGGYYALNAAKNITINGGNLTATSTNEAVAAAIHAGGTITVNGGNVKVYKSAEGGGGAMKAEGLIINGGNVYGEGYNYAVNADTVEINGGVVELNAISEEGDAQAFINGAPDLAKFENPAAVLGMNKDDVAKYDPDNAIEMDTGYFKVAKAGTADAPEVPADEPKPTDPPATEPPATEPPATEPPATEPPATSGNNDSGNTEDDKKPEETKKPSGNTGNSGNSVDEDIVILWVVVGIVFVAVCTGTVLILLKRKAAMAAAAPEETEEDTAE